MSKINRNSTSEELLKVIFYLSDTVLYWYMALLCSAGVFMIVLLLVFSRIVPETTLLIAPPCTFGLFVLGWISERAYKREATEKKEARK
ncbi:hypothetical protein [Shewanella cyperi]|uniref:hypothetical protein n=1 Tax=Shewanella cyperi TaxID=2814292 RepID=UPI001A93F673|nr:hypothetical protein [Shewanella cyperi]QSX39790.1 hypothetical protein JYB84_12295 [Shewanella cyperi]